MNTLQLWLAKPIARDMLSHAADSYPAESCGVLLASGAEEENEDGVVRPSRYVRLRNVACETHRAFVADPREWVELVAGLAARQERLVAVVHSHPNASAQLSETDAATMWRTVPFHVVVSVRSDGVPAAWRAWRWDDQLGAFREVCVAITGESGWTKSAQARLRPS